MEESLQRPRKPLGAYFSGVSVMTESLQTLLGTRPLPLALQPRLGIP